VKPWEQAIIDAEARGESRECARIVADLRERAAEQYPAPKLVGEPDPFWRARQALLEAAAFYAKAEHLIDHGELVGVPRVRLTGRTRRRNAS